MMKVPTVLSRAEVQRLFSVTEKAVEEANSEHERYNALLYAAVWRTLLSTGLRVSELTSLNNDSLFLEEKQLKLVRSKNKDTDYQPIRNTDAIKALRRYLDEKQKLNLRSRALFLSIRGNRLQPDPIRKAIKRYANKANIVKDVHPHTIRHTFGTEFLRSTGNLELTRKAMRHKNIETTCIYTHITKSDVERGLDKANL